MTALYMLASLLCGVGAWAVVLREPSGAGLIVLGLVGYAAAALLHYRNRRAAR